METDKEGGGGRQRPTHNETDRQKGGGGEGGGIQRLTHNERDKDIQINKGNC